MILLLVISNRLLKLLSQRSSDDWVASAPLSPCMGMALLPPNKSPRTRSLRNVNGCILASSGAQKAERLHSLCVHIFQHSAPSMYRQMIAFYWDEMERTLRAGARSTCWAQVPAEVWRFRKWIIRVSWLRRNEKSSTVYWDASRSSAYRIRFENFSGHKIVFTTVVMRKIWCENWFVSEERLRREETITIHINWLTYGRLLSAFIGRQKPVGAERKQRWANFLRDASAIGIYTKNNIY